MALNPDKNTAPVSGIVHGVYVSGELPPVFNRYLWPVPARSQAGGLSLRLHYRPGTGPSPVKEVWSGNLSDTDGESGIALSEQPDGIGLHIRGPHRGEFLIHDEDIEIGWVSAPDTAAHYFYSYAMPLWLELQGLPVLHASAVCREGKAILFAGRSGAGKSTLCSAMTRLGWKFVSDDGLAVHEHTGGGWRCYPGAPLVSLWPSSVEYRCSEDGPKWTHPLSEKQMRPLDAFPPDEGQSAATITAIYLIHRRGDNEEIHVERCGASESLVRLVEHSLAWAPMAALGFVTRRLEQFSRLAVEAGVKRLVFPGGSTQWERIQSVVERDLDLA